MRTLRDKLTYANVISTLCLFMLLGGGAYAASQLPKNSVGAKQIRNGSITGKEIKDGSIDGSKLAVRRAPAPPVRRRGLRGPAGRTGPQGVQGAQGPQGTTNSGAYATVALELGVDPLFAGAHPGFAGVERVETGIYCLTPDPGKDVSHPLASVDFGGSGGNKAKFVEPLANGVVLECASGQLEVRTYELFDEELAPGEDEIVREPSNSVAFTVFAPTP